MSKRVADKQLTDRNWQDEEEEEEAGEFKKAPENIMKTRVIKTAKRRVLNTDDGSKSSAFAGFAGFGGFGVAKPAAPTPALFSFTPKPAESKPAESKPADNEPAERSPDSKPATEKTPVSPAATDKPGDQNNSNDKSENNSHDEVFLKKLKKLNESVIHFAQKHVSENPFVILSNVFSDYDKHLKRIQAKNGSSNPFESSPQMPKFHVKTNGSSSNTTEATSSTVEETEQKPVKSFSLPSSTASSTPTFSFGGKPDSTTPSFSFKPSTETSPSAGGFSFTPSSDKPSTGGFSFKPASTAATTSLFGSPATTFTGFGGLTKAEPTKVESTTEEKEDDTPPVPEKVEHIEKEALYHIKCKLFLKSGDGWNEKGVGIANLKECNKKVQLLIRNDTPMGTVILNVLLHDKLPINKSGKNSLMIVATTEDNNTETYLVRVNKDKLEEFYSKLEEYKQGLSGKEAEEDES